MYNNRMNHLGRKTILFIMVLLVSTLVLFSYIFARSRADSLISNEEYIKSLQEASRGKQLAGQPSNLKDSEQIQENQPTNIIEEIIFQIKAVFKVR